MLDYVIDLLDDATDFSWASAKASHTVLLCHMEQGEIKSWLETEKIDRVGQAHTQRQSTSQNSSQRTQNILLLKLPLVYIITKVFVHVRRPRSHETKGVLYKHVCASCWSKDGK